MIPSPLHNKEGNRRVSPSGSLPHIIDRFTLAFGQALAWCSLLMAFLTTAVVILRYGFATGSIAMQEAITYLHGSLFMLGVAYALRCGAHVRVDIFYRNFSPRRQAWVNALGGIVFLLPLCVVIVVLCWGYVVDAWQIRESSPEPGGIPYLYVLKMLLPLMAINLALSGIADIWHNARVLILKSDDD
jgi:TRAP-type mannitol/chloroaromatic compound transport system permease small subunit